MTGLLGLADGAGNNHKIDALHQKRTIGLILHIFRSDVNNWVAFEINSEPSLCFSYSSGHTSSKRAIGLIVHIFKSDVNNWVVFEIISEPSLCFSYSSVTEGMGRRQDCSCSSGVLETNTK